MYKTPMELTETISALLVPTDFRRTAKTIQKIATAPHANGVTTNTGTTSLVGRSFSKGYLRLAIARSATATFWAVMNHLAHEVPAIRVTELNKKRKRRSCGEAAKNPLTTKHE
jgi:hypothetical protein